MQLSKNYLYEYCSLYFPLRCYFYFLYIFLRSFQIKNIFTANNWLLNRGVTSNYFGDGSSYLVVFCFFLKFHFKNILIKDS